MMMNGHTYDDDERKAIFESEVKGGTDSHTMEGSVNGVLWQEMVITGVLYSMRNLPSHHLPLQKKKRQKYLAVLFFKTIITITTNFEITTISTITFIVF